MSEFGHGGGCYSQEYQCPGPGCAGLDGIPLCQVHVGSGCHFVPKRSTANVEVEEM